MSEILTWKSMIDTSNKCFTDTWFIGEVSFEIGLGKIVEIEILKKY